MGEDATHHNFASDAGLVAVVIVGIPLQPVSHDHVVRSSLQLSSELWGCLYFITLRIPYFFPPGMIPDLTYAIQNVYRYAAVVEL